MNSPYDDTYFSRLNRFDRIGNNSYREAQRLLTLAALCKPRKDDEVLEIGCGTGHYTRMLAQQVRRIVGVDSSETAILKARSSSNAENIQYVLADIQHLDRFPRESFQKIVAVDVVEHLSDGQFENVLSEVERLLTKQGLFVLFTPCRTHWIERCKSRNLLIKQTAGHVGVRSERELRHFMERSGLKVKSIIRFETCIPVLRTLERHLKNLPLIGSLFVSRLGMSSGKTGPGTTANITMTPIYA